MNIMNMIYFNSVYSVYGELAIKLYKNDNGLRNNPRFAAKWRQKQHSILPAQTERECVKTDPRFSPHAR